MADNNTDTANAVATQSDVVLPAGQGAPAAATSLVEVISRAASDPNVDVGKLERLVEMHDKIIARENEAKFNAALATTQAAMGVVALDASNPHTRSKYASYAGLDRALRPIYTAHGFSISFNSGDSPAEGCVRVLAYLAHAEGFTRTYHVDMPADGKGAKGGDVMTKTHAAAAAFSYGQRYLLKLAFNVATGEADDDGNQAGGIGPKISAAQKEKIIAEMVARGVETAAFIKYLCVESLDDLPASKFGPAMTALRTKERTPTG